MPNLDLSILIVDDAKFSSTIIGKTLSKAGYRDLRIANDAHTALKMLEQRKASVLIADWLMPEMDGLELSQRVRQIDEQANHFTYTIILTAKESPAALTEAFDKGVDDFIFKADMSRQLLPRVYAADRMADRQNALLVANQLLLENNRHLEKHSYVDLETGAGNQRKAREALDNLLKHTESRGGATSYMLIQIKNWPQIKTKQNPMTQEELATGITRRLRNLIRPLDVLCRIGEDQYAIIAQFAHIDHCSQSSYRRIHDGINHKSFRTSSGYLSITAATSVCTIDDKTTAPSAKEVEVGGQSLLAHAIDTGTLAISRWKEEAAALKN